MAKIIPKTFIVLLSLIHAQEQRGYSHLSSHVLYNIISSQKYTSAKLCDFTTR